MKKVNFFILFAIFDPCNFRVPILSFTTHLSIEKNAGSFCPAVLFAAYSRQVTDNKQRECVRMTHSLLSSSNTVRNDTKE